MRDHAEAGARSDALGSVGADRRLGWLGVCGWLALWAAVSASGLVSPLVLPTPWRVVAAAVDIGDTLLVHILATLARVVVAFVAGVLAGSTVGLVMQYSRRAFGVLDGLVETFRPVPVVAFVPFFILVFGFAEIGKVLVASIGVALVVVVSTVEAIDRVPAGILRWGLVCGLSRRAVFQRVIIPAALPDTRAGLRVALAGAVGLVVVSEFMGATYGLGYLISVAKVTLTTPTLLMAAMLLGWVGWSLDRGLRAVFDWACWWDVRAKGAVR